MNSLKKIFSDSGQDEYTGYYLSGEAVDNGDFVWVHSRGFDFQAYIDSESDTGISLVGLDNGQLVYGDDVRYSEQCNAWGWDEDVKLLEKAINGNRPVFNKLTFYFRKWASKQMVGS